MSIKQRTLLIILAIVITLLIPPFLCGYLYRSELEFRPDLFITDWMKFVASIVSTALAFYLIHVYWSSARTEFELERAMLNASYDLRRLKDATQQIELHLGTIISGLPVENYESNINEVQSVLVNLKNATERISREALTDELQELTSTLDSACSNVEVMVDVLSGTSVKEIKDTASHLSKDIEACNILIRRELRGLEKKN